MALASWMWFNCLKAPEPLQGDTNTKSLGVPAAHLTDFGKMKG